MTAATMFMDAATDFGGGYTPADADNLERGPVRVRNALQFSLNIPSVKAMVVNTPEHVFARAKDFGMTFQTDTPSAGLALALGVQEVRPVDLATAYGTLANGGKLHSPHDDPRDQGRVRKTDVGRADHASPRAPRRPRPRRPTSSPTSSPATRTRR